MKNRTQRLKQSNKKTKTTRNRQKGGGFFSWIFESSSSEKYKEEDEKVEKYTIDIVPNDRYGGNIYLAPYGTDTWIRNKIQQISPFLLKNCPSKIKKKVEEILQQIDNKSSPITPTEKKNETKTY